MGVGGGRPLEVAEELLQLVVAVALADVGDLLGEVEAGFDELLGLEVPIGAAVGVGHRHDGAAVLDEVAREVECSFVVVAGPQGDAGRLQGQSLREAEEQWHALLLGGAFDCREAVFVQQDGVAQSHCGGDLAEVEVDAVVGVVVEALDEGAAAVAELEVDDIGDIDAVDEG
ncbi:hypothetical protein ACFV7O_33400 [Streptomyces tendae]|uniref:hypothetical protein n=1 Tax=Streptomyces tendae TaxID=1932 RepID=UPI00365E0730